MDKLKSKVQELMLEKDDSIKHIEEWPREHETEVQQDDVPIGKL